MCKWEGYCCDAGEYFAALSISLVALPPSQKEMMNIDIMAKDIKLTTSSLVE